MTGARGCIVDVLRAGMVVACGEARRRHPHSMELHSMLRGNEFDGCIFVAHGGEDLDRRSTVARYVAKKNNLAE